MTTTEPDYFHTDEAVTSASTETLREVLTKAKRTYATCGGHNLAARMKAVIERVETELASRS